MSKYKIVLRKNGAKRGELTGYATKQSAINEAQTLADSAGSGVKVYVEPVRAKANRKAPRRRNTHLKKGQKVRISKSFMQSPEYRYLMFHPRMKWTVLKVQKSPMGYLARSTPMYKGESPEEYWFKDRDLVAYGSKTDTFPGTGYKGKTPKRKNPLGKTYGPVVAFKIGKSDVQPDGYFHPEYEGAWVVMAQSIRGRSHHEEKYFFGPQAQRKAKEYAKQLEEQTYRHNPSRGSTWLQEADEEIEERGTEGAFTKQARRAGYSNTMEFARKVMAGWRSGKKTVYNKKTKKQQRITKKTMYRANFAINAQKRRNPKAAHPKFEGASDAEIASPKNRDLSIRQLAFRYGKTVKEIKAILMRHGKPPQWNSGSSYTDQELLVYLDSAPSGITVADLKYAFGGTSSKHSARLKKLADKGYLRKRKHGKSYRYHLVRSNPAVMSAIGRGLGEAGRLAGRGLAATGRLAGQAGKAAWKGGKRAAQYGYEYGKEGAARGKETAQAAVIAANLKDLERCAARLDITPSDLSQMPPYIQAVEDAQQHIQTTQERRGARQSKRQLALEQRWNPSKGYYAAYTAPNGSRYWTHHSTKGAADRKAGVYRREGFKNVRVSKSQPKNAIPFGLMSLG